MENSIHSSALIFNLNERLFMNSLEGVDEEQSWIRISDHSNPLIWVATHTVSSRYNSLMFLGKKVENPFGHLFEKFKPFDANDVYPSLEEVKEEWKKVSALMKDALQTITAEHLGSDAPFKLPIDDATYLGAIVFFAQHESYDIGQMGYLKKYLTKEAMKY